MPGAHLATFAASVAVAAALFSLPGCGVERAVPVSVPGPAAAAWPDASARELLRRLPSPSVRCVVLRPSLLPPRLRPLVAEVGQAPPLPWLVSLTLSAYAAAEHEGPAGTRELVELLRFRDAGRAQIRDELLRVDRRTLSFADEDGEGCAPELGCVAVEVRFVDRHTVQLRSRAPASLERTMEGSCTELLHGHVDALEVAARGGSSLGGSRRLTLSALHVDGESLVRTLRHRFEDEASAERAVARIVTGEEEAPTVGSSLVEARATREGPWLVQRARLLFEELALAAEDRKRLQQANAQPTETDLLAVVPEEHDTDGVRRFHDAALSVHMRGHPLPAHASLMALDGLLTRARVLQPDDEGLARRHYQWRLTHMQAPKAALEVAEQALARAHGEPSAWQALSRRALLYIDVKRFRDALRKAYALSPHAAQRMAEEVVAKVHAGGEYERAEWAFLTARSLCLRAGRQGKVPTPGAPQLPLVELPRMLAYLARLPGERESLDLGVHIVARGEANAIARDPRSTWSAESSACGWAGQVLAAASFDDPQLLGQGELLQRLFSAGELELLIGLDPLQQRTPARGPTLRLKGHVEHGVFTLQEVSPALREVRWPLLDRALAKPLATLRGAVFPPDEWRIELHTVPQAVAALVAAKAVDGADCERDALVVRCRGSFTDARVAGSALRRAVSGLLHKEARALWSSAE